VIAMPGLVGGALRLISTFLPPIVGTRKLVTGSTALLLLPLVGWGLTVQNQETLTGAVVARGDLRHRRG
jgi:NNP family nitrate/nitrite transporter-like MFS transporter